MDIDDYCELAKSRNKLKTNSALARELGLSHNSPTAWKTRRAWPSDEVMIKLAKMAGVDPMDGILDLNIWRSSGEAISLYTRMKKAMTAALVLLVFSFFAQGLIPFETANAAAYPAQSFTSTIYIMENIVRTCTWFAPIY